MIRTPTESQRKRSRASRMVVIHVFFLITVLVVIARLLELQIIKGAEYHRLASDQHFAGVVLPAKRGEILSRNSKTGETSILATNTTLNMVYVDPYITDDPAFVAETLSDLLVTEHIHQICSRGEKECPREIISYFTMVYDPLERIEKIDTARLLEPLPSDLPLPLEDEIPDLTEVRRLFARSIERRIEEKQVRFVPLVYSATKVQLDEVESLGIPGIEVSRKNKLIYADPEFINQSRVVSIGRRLSGVLNLDTEYLRKALRSRPLRYTPIMRRLPPSISARLQEAFLRSSQETQKRKSEASTREQSDRIFDPMRSIALIPEHWRLYPDTSVASHVLGFLNANQEAQYGVERAFNAQLRGQEGLISSVSDPQGGQILTTQQKIVDARDGDTIVLTIDRFVQKEVEKILAEATTDFEADSGQAIVMDPFSGRIIAMANTPLFDSNKYGNVFEREPLILDAVKQKQVVVELYHPDTNAFIVKAYIDDIFSEEGRSLLTVETQQKIDEVERLYELEDMVRYYHYVGENSRREIFPTNRPEVWMKYKNNIGVGAYINRNIQEIYEPGSVLKAVTMAVALDQGEVTPLDTYDDEEAVKIDEYTIRNALNNYFGTVTMTNCLEYSINTCMTSVSMKLGKKLFHRMLTRFGFGKISGIELDDELPGEILPWRNWSIALLATASYGQGISATPLQLITAFSALANGGKLMRPMIIDSILKSDGTVDLKQPRIVDQVITRETADTVTAMLTSAVSNGYARTAKVRGYRIAGKTGTSQIAGPGGKYETGTGANITSFAGYAPIHKPKFVILVKFDRPRAKDIEFGSQSAAPVFKQIATFLFEYYGIPPDDL